MILLQRIKEDWLYRLPHRLRNMKFRGLNRPAYALICIVYYSVKSIFLLYLVVLYYGYKFIFWDIWNLTFKLDQREWFCRMLRVDNDDEYDYDDYGYEEEYVEQEPDGIEDLPFCQLFAIGSNMCILVDRVEMCPDEVAFIRVLDDESYTPLYKRKVRRDRAGNRFIVFNSTNYYLDDNKTQPVIKH